MIQHIHTYFTTRKDATLVAQRRRFTSLCFKHTDTCLSNQPIPPAQDAERHLIHRSIVWIFPALYKLGLKFSLPMSNFHCLLSRRFRANRSHWEGILCGVLGANTVVTNNSTIHHYVLNSLLFVLCVNIDIIQSVLGSRGHGRHVTP